MDQSLAAVLKNTQPSRIFEFGPYRLDTAARLLLRGREPVALTSKVFDTLVLLVENRGRVVEKDEFMSVVWPGSFVEEGNLAQNIFTLRKALGERAGERRYILTIPRRGYLFVAGVRAASGERPRRFRWGLRWAREMLHRFL